MESRNPSFFEDIHVNLKKSQVHQNDCLRLLMEIVRMKIMMLMLELRRSNRLRTEKSFWSRFSNIYVLEGEPWTFKEAVNSTKGLMWKEVIKSEIDSILQNHI